MTKEALNERIQKAKCTYRNAEGVATWNKQEEAEIEGRGRRGRWILSQEKEEQ